MRSVRERPPRTAAASPFRKPALGPGLRELAVAAVAALAISAALYGPAAGEGGLHADDWAWEHTYHFMEGSGSSLFDLLDASEVYPENYRPGNNVVHAVTQWLSGGDQGGRGAIGLILGATSVFMFFAALRVIGLTTWAAGSAGLLLAVLPSIDSLRILISTFHQPVALSLYLAGVIAAIAAMRAGSARAAVLHLASAVLLLAAILTFEALLLPIALGGAVYAVAGVPRALAIRRGAADVLLAVAGWLLVRGAVDSVREPDLAPGHLADRTGDLIPALLDIFRFSLPADSVVWGPAGIVAALALAAGLRLAWRGGAAAAIRGWGAIGLAGLVIAAIGYGPLLAASSDLTPSWSGVNDRMNVIGSLGHVLILASMMWLAAIAIGSALRRSGLVVPVAAALVAVTAAGLGAQLIRNLDDWRLSARLQEDVLAGVERALGPDPADGTVVVTFRHPYYTPRGATVFFNIDQTFALQVRRDDLTIQSRPVFDDQYCARQGYAFVGTAFAGPTVLVAFPYRNLIFSVPYEGRSRRITGKASCVAARREFAQGQPAFAYPGA